MPAMTPIDPRPPTDDEEPTRVFASVAGSGPRRIASRYEIVHTLAQGGMAEVLLARHVDLGRLVAVKVIKRDLPGKETVDFESRFRSEARVLAALQHPHIVSIHDFGLLDDRRCFLAMEYVEGPTLADLLKRDGPLPIPRLVDLVLQIASALHYAHVRGVVHQDVTPSNLIVKRGDQGTDVVKLVDFGIAQVGTPEPAARGGVLLGSPHCMSPEQIDDGPVDARTDVYALGATMFRLLTGRWPYTGKDNLTILLGHVQSPVPSIRDVAPDRELPEALDALVQRCLAKSPADRFSSMEALADALRAFHAAELAPPPEAPPLPGAVWAGLGAIATMALLAVMWLALGPSPESTPGETAVAEVPTAPEVPRADAATLAEVPAPAPPRAEPRAPTKRTSAPEARPEPRVPAPAAAPEVVLPTVPRGYHAIPDDAWPRGADKARAHHAAGLEAAARRQPTSALGEFLASWDGFAHPATARNAARAYEEKGDLQRALIWYARASGLAPGAASAIAGDIDRVRRALGVADGERSR